MESRNASRKDYYATLGVSPDASVAEIKKAYRALAHQFHPDLVSSEADTQAAMDRMVEINEAFAVLSDAKKRASYDQSRTGSSKTADSSEPASVDWKMPEEPTAAPAVTPASNSAVANTVGEDFLQKLKALVAQSGASANLQDEPTKPWLWSFQGKTWGGNYWVSLRVLPLLSTNTARELLKQIEAIVGKRRSGWKNNAFVFVIAFKEFQDSDIVLKLLRTYSLREENSVPRNMVNIVVMDATQRRSVFCGKKSGDELLHGILHALGASA